jgi:hypothetical protein
MPKWTILRTKSASLVVRIQSTLASETNSPAHCTTYVRHSTDCTCGDFGHLGFYYFPHAVEWQLHFCDVRDVWLKIVQCLLVISRRFSPFSHFWDFWQIFNFQDSTRIFKIIRMQWPCHVSGRKTALPGWRGTETSLWREENSPHMTRAIV